MKLLIALALLAGAAIVAQPINPGGSIGCTPTGTPLLGYVPTGIDGFTCSWQSVGAASVDATTIKNAWFLTDGGTANAVTGTTTTAFPGAYATGQAVIFKANATNTTSTTININSLGNKNLTKAGSTALAAGNKVSGVAYLAIYDGTQFQLVAYTAIAADIPTIQSTQVSGLPTFPAGAIVGTTDAQTLSSKTLTSPIISAISNTGTLTLPTSTDTLLGRATTDTLTNKTFDTAGTGNSFSIAGVGATANTGTGSVVRATTPTLVTPVLGVATATSINKVAFTAPATGSTLVIADGKTLTASNTLTLAGTDSTTITFPSASATIPQTIASGTSALGTSAIGSAACATVVTTTATGTASTDSISWNPNGSIKAVTGYVPATTGGLSIAAYPTTNNVNFDVCNWSSGSLTPGAVTINWRVVR